MGDNQYFTRIDTFELKALIIKTIGHKKAEKYFANLSKFFTFKINKKDLSKICIQTLGKENLPLHNLLIGSIVKNANKAKSPPTNRFRASRSRPTPVRPTGQSLNVNYPQVVAHKAPEKQSPTELLSTGSRPPVEVPSPEDGEEVEQVAAESPCVQSRTPVTAPLGVICKGYLRNVPHDGCHNNGELPDTKSLRASLERKLETEGINVSVDCANLLNNGLDAFLKRLIEPCVELVASRKKHNPAVHYRGSGFRTTPITVSMSDFRTVMEMNPRILGDGSAIQLERISFLAWEK